MENKVDSLYGKKPTKKIRNDYSQTRNYVVCQQSVLIALLNQYYDIVIKKPKKRSTISAQLFQVCYIVDDGQRIDVIDFIEKRCLEKKLIDLQLGLNESSVMRRYSNNKITENHHFLLDLIIAHGYIFDSVISKRNRVIASETIKNLFYGRVFLFSKKDIDGKGKVINSYLLSLFSVDPKAVLLHRNDSSLKSFLKTN